MTWDEWNKRIQAKGIPQPEREWQTFYTAVPLDVATAFRALAAQEKRSHSETLRMLLMWALEERGLKESEEAKQEAKLAAKSWRKKEGEL